jgi:hypothetical protein
MFRFDAGSAAQMIEKSIQKYEFQTQDDAIAMMRVAAESVKLAVDYLEPLHRNVWNTSIMPAVLHSLQAWLERGIVPDEGVFNQEADLSAFPSPRNGYQFMRNALHELFGSCHRILQFNNPDPEFIPIYDEDDDVLQDVISHINLALGYCRQSSPRAQTEMATRQLEMIRKYFPGLLPPGL